MYKYVFSFQILFILFGINQIVLADGTSNQSSYFVTLKDISIQIPQTTSNLLVDLIEFPLAYNIELKSSRYTTDNSTLLTDESANSLCSLYFSTIEIQNTWIYRANIANISDIVVLNNMLLAFNQTNSQIMVFSINPKPLGVYQILGAINIDSSIPINSSFIFEGDIKNNMIYIVNSTSLYTYQIPINPVTNFTSINSSNQVLGYITHQNINVVKIYYDMLFVGSEKGLDIYNVSNISSTRTNQGYSLNLLCQIYKYANVQDITWDDQGHIFVLNSNQTLNVYDIKALNSTSNLTEKFTLQVQAGGKYLLFQNGIITIVGNSDSWYLQDFFVQINQTSNNLFTFTSNRLFNFNQSNIMKINGDQEFLYIMGSESVFMMQAGVPIQYAANVSSFTYDFLPESFGNVISAIPVITGSYPGLILQTNIGLSFNIIVVTDPFLECKPSEKSPNGYYILDITGYTSDCGPKTFAQDQDLTHACILKQKYEIFLYSDKAPDSDNRSLALALGLSIGLILAVIFGIGCFCWVRKYKKKYQELEFKMKSGKFEKLPNEAEANSNHDKGLRVPKIEVSGSSFSGKPERITDREIVKTQDIIEIDIGEKPVNIDQIYVIEHETNEKNEQDVHENNFDFK